MFFDAAIAASQPIDASENLCRQFLIRSICDKDRAYRATKETESEEDKVVRVLWHGDKAQQLQPEVEFEDWEETAPRSQSAVQEGVSQPIAEVQPGGAVPEELLSPPGTDHQEPEVRASATQSPRSISSADSTEQPPPTDVPSPTEEAVFEED